MDKRIIEEKIQIYKAMLSNFKCWLNLSFFTWVTLIFGAQSGFYQSLKVEAFQPGLFGWFNFIAFLGVKVLMFISAFGVLYFLKSIEVYHSKLISLHKKKLLSMNDPKKH